MRVCKVCKEQKPLADFANAGTVKGVKYFRHLCVPCYSESKKPRRLKIRKWYLEYRKTLHCENCGNNDHRVIEHHHPNDDKFMVICEMVNNGFSIEKIKAEIEKCQVLCANCHRIVTYNNRWYRDLEDN